MFPWNYGFHWTAATVIFLGAFYAVLAAVAATLLAAALRSRRDVRAHAVEEIRWQSDFDSLPARDRLCRHAITGELAGRECPNGFDCRTCETHTRLATAAVLAATRSIPAMREKPEVEIYGMNYPVDRLYHRGHTWVHPASDGTLTVGIDDLGRRLLGGADAIDFPQRGARLRANGPVFTLRRGSVRVRVLSPVDGEVVGAHFSGPAWFLKVKPLNGGFDLRHLLSGPEIKPWVAHEIERLQLALAGDAALPTLADGGIPVDDIAAACPGADWDAVCGVMFLDG